MVDAETRKRLESRAHELELELARTSAIVIDAAECARDIATRTGAALDDQLVSGELAATLERARKCVKRGADTDVDAAALHAILRAQARRLAAFVDLRSKVKQSEFHRLEGERAAILKMLDEAAS